MDPNANLSEIRTIIADSLKRIDAGKSPDAIDSERLVELIDALDSWMSKGGFLPECWQVSRAKRTT